MKKIWLLILISSIFLTGIALAVFFSYNTRLYGQAKPQPSSSLSITPENKLPKSNMETIKYEIPILMYHYIRVADPNDQLGVSLSVSPQNFDKQIQWLNDNGYVSIHLADLADPQKDAINSILVKNKKPVVITFDDGYHDAYTQAYPILKKYGQTGTFFIIRNKINKANGFYMNQEEIDELAAGGMEIGSHTLTHPNLTNSTDERMRTEIFDSKNSAQVFCYPSGKYNSKVENLIKEAGYKAAVTTGFGLAHENSDLYALKRVRIENGDGKYLGNRIQKAKEMSTND